MIAGIDRIPCIATATRTPPRWRENCQLSGRAQRLLPCCIAARTAAVPWDHSSSANCAAARAAAEAAAPPSAGLSAGGGAAGLGGAGLAVASLARAAACCAAAYARVTRGAGGCAGAGLRVAAALSSALSTVPARGAGRAWPAFALAAAAHWRGAAQVACPVRRCRRTRRLESSHAVKFCVAGDP